MTSILSVRELITFGWNGFKARPWFFVGTFAIYAVVQFVLGAFQEALPGIISMLLSVVVSTILYVGLMTVYLKAHEDSKAPTYGDLWNLGPFWSYLGASILIMLAVGLGLILLIVPGIYLAIALSMTGYLVVDRGMNPIEAMKESFRITKGNRWKLLLFGLAIFGLTILGMIPFFLGLLVVAPVSMLAGAHAYRTLAHASAEVAPVTSAV